MPFYQFKHEQLIPASIDVVWDFISGPDNLIEITPSYFDLRVISNSAADRMYAGMIVTYTVRPIWGIKTKWMTEITQVKEKEYFIDEQRMGPYRLWHHQHRLEAVDGGVVMTDIVTYAPPLGFLGAIANKLFIKTQIRRIFEYRKAAVEKRFAL